MPEPSDRHLVIVGGGPAGVFAALAAAETAPAFAITLLERDATILCPWRSYWPPSVGLTIEIWDPAEFAQRLIRGSKEMLGAFTRFGPGDFEAWLEEHGAEIQIDDNGHVRIAESGGPPIAHFFESKLKATRVRLLTASALSGVDVKSTGGFWLTLKDDRTLQADQLIIAGGGLIANRLKSLIADDLGHTVTECHQTLTGFQSNDDRLRGLEQVAPATRELRIGDTDRRVEGQTWLEPWGISGPAAWELSARNAEHLEKLLGRFPLRIGWLPGGPRAAARLIDGQLRQFPQGKIGAYEDPALPPKLWSMLITAAAIAPDTSWDSLAPTQRSALVRELSAGEFEVVKKKNIRSVSSVLGGVSSEEIDFRTMASRKTPGLFFAGDVLDATGLGPAENLQIAWTSGWLAGTGKCPVCC